MGTPTRFTYGLSTRAKNSPLGNYGMPDPTAYLTYFNDFLNYDPNNWVITSTQGGAGSSSEALQNEFGGVLLLTNDNASGDNVFMQWSGLNTSPAVKTTFAFVSGKELWFRSRFKVSDATLTAVVMGLQVADTSPLAVSDGVYFLKASGSTALNLIAIKTAGGTTTSANPVATMANDTYVEASFYYDGKSTIYGFNDQTMTAAISNVNMPSALLTVSFGVQNGEAVAKTMSLDYIFASAER